MRGVVNNIEVTSKAVIKRINLFFPINSPLVYISNSSNI